MVKQSTIQLMDTATASQPYVERAEKLKGLPFLAIQHYRQQQLSLTSPQQQVSAGLINQTSYSCSLEPLKHLKTLKTTKNI